MSEPAMLELSGITKEYRVGGQTVRALDGARNGATGLPGRGSGRGWGG